MSIELGTILADFTTSLSAAMVAGATTGTLQSATDDDGVALPTGRYFFTIDGSNSSKEHISCTLTGTALTAIKSVSRQGVETSGTVRAHRLGASVTLTDFAHLLAINNVLVTGYASAVTPTTDYQLATKKYIDDASFAGGTNASTTTPGFVELPTQAEVDARTASGGSGPLSVIPSTLRSTKYHDYIADAGSTDAYAITVVPAITAYAAGQEFTFKANTANTGACTLNVCALGAISIYKDVTSELSTGDIAVNQIVKVVYDASGKFQIISSPNIYGDFGDGSDGDVTISGTTTLTSDMYYNNLVVTGTLNTANWRVFIKGTLSGNGTIQNNGGNGGNGGTPTAGTAGAKIADGYFVTLPGYVGGLGSGGSGDAGGAQGGSATAGGNSLFSIGVVGVVGGGGGSPNSGSYAGANGGVAGTKTDALQRFGLIRHQTISAIDYALTGTTNKLTGPSGSGSGGGGGDRKNGDTSTGGGGGGSGAPGGIMALYVNNWTGTVTLKSTGGNGGNGGDGVKTGSGEAGGGGGGGGGSGGRIFVVYKTKTWTGSYVLTGGTGGTGGVSVTASTPGNGTAGTAGNSSEINVSTLL